MFSRRNANLSFGRHSGVRLILAVLLVAGLAACDSSTPARTAAPTPTVTSASSPSTPAADPTPPTSASSKAPTTPAPSTSTTPAAVRADAALDAAVDRYDSDTVSVGAQDLVTGRVVLKGEADGLWTASVYKLFVLEALLLQHQDRGDSLSSSEVSLATRAIEHSDNVAGYALWQDAGGNPGLLSAAHRLGVRHIEGGNSDPAFTQVGARACLRFLRVLVTPSALTPASQSFVLGLMRNVQEDQRWGVGAASDGSRFANKNGWLAVDNGNGGGETDDGRWIVGSVGIVTVRGHRTLVAVMTQHQSSMGVGVTAVEKLARLVTAAVRD